MKTILRIITLAIIFPLLGSSCQNQYEKVTSGAIYSGNPYVMLSSETASISLSASNSNNSTTPGLFVDSLVLSHKLDYDLVVTLETNQKNTNGSVGTNFRYQNEVTINAGSHFGKFEVEVLDIDPADAKNYSLSIIIQSTNSDSVIAGLNGIKYENADRQKRNKTYSFR